MMPSGGRILSPDSAVYHDAAQIHKLDLALVLAIAEHESSFRVAAINPEQVWRYFWDVRADKPFRKLTAAELASEFPPADFTSMPNVPRDAEWWMQQCGLGVMQVQGGTARELGCKADFLTELCADPVMAVDLGCRYLAKKVARYSRIEEQISSYNAGIPTWQKPNGNKGTYVDPVLAAFGRHRARLGG